MRSGTRLSRTWHGWLYYSKSWMDQVPGERIERFDGSFCFLPSLPLLSKEKKTRSTFHNEIKTSLSYSRRVSTGDDRRLWQILRIVIQSVWNLNTNKPCQVHSSWSYPKVNVMHHLNLLSWQKIYPRILSVFYASFIWWSGAFASVHSLKSMWKM